MRSAPSMRQKGKLCLMSMPYIYALLTMHSLQEEQVCAACQTITITSVSSDHLYEYMNDYLNECTKNDPNECMKNYPNEYTNDHPNEYMNNYPNI